MVSKKSETMVMAFVWFFCWTIQVITGTPVGSLEMDRDFGSPLTDEELECIPTFSKAASGTPMSEGNDIVILPNKNAYVNQKWPNPNEIPYVIDSTFDDKARCAIGYAMNHYHKNTCIRFVPRTDQNDYIQINRLDTENFSCYSSGLGYYEGEGAHGVTLSPSCYAYQAGTIMHELMHRVGFHHEHTRPDRDEYIDVLWNEISDDWKAQYQIAEGSSLLLSYDYGSVMHYPLGTEMVTKQETDIEIGQRKGLSELDIGKLQRMYCPS
ncbi:zinc metalloproteinase nas-4-like [Daphnia pulex]|uniref:zinc metalloproteinase nas-4-like n=1 Tax=Daphnia pulex TaxID=6669 RepID=UPI001EDD57E6|nr:zinc metalloproteinase nas-4-like [Daphnia pulex]XP_046438585.1 zinc metalloproteinase nas-4-like [Daphnia pulex]